MLSCYCNSMVRNKLISFGILSRRRLENLRMQIFAATTWQQLANCTTTYLLHTYSRNYVEDSPSHEVFQFPFIPQRHFENIAQILQFKPLFPLWLSSVGHGLGFH